MKIWTPGRLIATWLGTDDWLVARLYDLTVVLSMTAGHLLAAVLIPYLA